MVIISKTILNGFTKEHPEAESALEKWYEETSAADWNNFPALRNTFNSADCVGNDRYVFNIKGNQFRLIALIIFKVRTVFILFIGTHAEYDSIKASEAVYKP
ncbi:type II toxin-antitoxin system HigB family toxin [Chitinophaga alhagiae]|uniref:Type II toxin-antitoxin system HigB family toxin n=1 Tax=Chitinophaga alhagiae TaxID=2203219 RepID=A0ABM6W8L8_9BACT|nr:type II toxin-antitoxin system HigB family toxin [Chitinophaga alhagiae]AWO00264.1 type II toxin-antitoxin system HigB family toxin [Chitinophaga alhagiae]